MIRNMADTVGKLYGIDPEDLKSKLLHSICRTSHTRMWRLVSTLHRLHDYDYELYTRMNHNASSCKWLQFSEKLGLHCW